jgi:hypothetical protein
MAEYLPVKIYAGQPGTSAGTLYTAAQGEQIVIDNVIICNTTGSAAVLTTLDVVPSGGTAGVTHRISGGLSVAANTTVSLASSLAVLGIVLEEGDTVNGSQTTSAALTLTVTGRAVHN